MRGELTHRCMNTEVEDSTMPDYTSIRVTPELADELHSRKSRGDSYEDVIWRLIERADEQENDE